jgi:SAM-dependent methyltransferase
MLGLLQRPLDFLRSMREVSAPVPVALSDIAEAAISTSAPPIDELEDVRRYWSTAQAWERCTEENNVASDRRGIYDVNVLRGILERTRDLSGVNSKVVDVLDVGCGDGRMTRYLHMIADNVTGTDVVNRPPRLASQVTHIEGIGDVPQPAEYHFELMSDPYLPFPDESFDVVVCVETLQHNDERLARHTLTEMLRLLRRGGVAYFDAPDRIHPRFGRVRRPGRPKVSALPEDKIERLARAAGCYIRATYRDVPHPRGWVLHRYVVTKPNPEKEPHDSKSPLYGRLAEPDMRLGAAVLRDLATSRTWILRRTNRVAFLDDVAIRHTVTISFVPPRRRRIGRPRRFDVIPLTMLSKSLLAEFAITDHDGTAVAPLSRREDNWIAWSMLVAASRNVLGHMPSQQTSDALRNLVFATRRPAGAILRLIQRDAKASPELTKLLDEDYFVKLLHDFAANWLLLLPRPAERVPTQHTISYVEWLQWNPQYRDDPNRFTSFYGGPLAFVFGHGWKTVERLRALRTSVFMTLGWSPITAVFPAPSFADCQTFHFEPECPPGLKLVRTVLHTREIDGSRREYIGVAGGGKAHVYGKCNAWAYGGKVEVALVARPRGAIRQAMFATVATAVMLSIGLLFIDRLSGVAHGTNVEASVAVLIALPPTIAALATRPDEHEASAALHAGVKLLLLVSAMAAIVAALVLALHQKPAFIALTWISCTGIAWLVGLFLLKSYVEPIRQMRQQSERFEHSPVVVPRAHCAACGRVKPVPWNDSRVLDEQDLGLASLRDTYLFLAPSAEGQRAGFQTARTTYAARASVDRVTYGRRARLRRDSGEAPSITTESTCWCTKCRDVRSSPTAQRARRLRHTEHVSRWVVLGLFILLSDWAVRVLYRYGYALPKPQFILEQDRYPIPLIIVWAVAGTVVSAYAWWRHLRRRNLRNRAEAWEASAACASCTSV